jgi:hypothetical protein
MRWWWWKLARDTPGGGNWKLARDTQEVVEMETDQRHPGGGCGEY